MLYIVLVLVLTALAMVITALVTANVLWSWVSIGFSALAGIVLVIEWGRRRSSGNTEGSVESDEDSTDSAGAVESVDTRTDEGERNTEEVDTESNDSAEADPEPEKTEKQTTLLPVSGQLDGDEGDPPEESTDAADLLIVAELDVEVQVVDERPRYHLGDCYWIENQDTIPVPAREARELGFTPCARCGPDSRLAAEHRDKRVSRK